MERPSIDQSVATFSIVGCDLQSGDWGIAVQSRHLAVGAIVPWAKAGAGAIAIQAVANVAYGPQALDLMENGWTAEEVLRHLLETDADNTERQVGLVDARGGVAAYTGVGCNPWAGHVTGDGYTCQGNTLVGQGTVQAMSDTFETSSGSLADRLVAALAAGQTGGGDRRGQQSAALLVVRQGGGYRGRNDRFLDLRVDDHPKPIEELGRLLDLHKVYRAKPSIAELPAASQETIREIQTILKKTGHYLGPISGDYDAATRAALKEFYGES